MCLCIFIVLGPGRTRWVGGGGGGGGGEGVVNVYQVLKPQLLYDN